MVYNRKVNPCRPGHGASCALCCGSHNYRMTAEEMEDLFTARGNSAPAYPLKHPDDSAFEKLYRDAMQCPHVGICSGSEVCCLVYGEYDMKGGLRSFFNGTCKNFYCAAWDELSDRQVVFAARLMGDWYYYSLLLNDIEALQDLCSDYESAGDVPDDVLEQLREDLLERFIAEDGK